ncbi:Gfo/Idh/MocA family protein [Ahrensia sp. R2A130]|uniref:Gfo/Idh/MocA family protein n=1 Tax=Ahrensia sp. R2A130 TaxID=744979 RepID=UPI0001E0ACCD|nr:Gfo/Idh/MocA family oxidoreductase [Ahrensia sp. R2A130]EFL88446.1 oxidoreductase domain-containing protein [Ahrensia sp. R2A130]
MTIRYGIIGCGMMGREHIANIALLEGATVSAICEPDAEQLRLSCLAAEGPSEGVLFGKLQSGAAENVRGFASLDAYLVAGDSYDVHLIAAPNDTHRAILERVFADGKPVLCEKPICTTVEHTREIIELADGREDSVWVAMEYRYMPPVQALLEAVREGVTGAPRMMAIREHRFPFLEKVGDWNRFSQRTGGTLVEKCCHYWDLMRLVLQADPVRVFASAAMDANHLDERYDGKMPDIIDNAYVIVDFDNGARGMLDLCMFAEGSRWQEQLAVTGPKARVEAFIPGPARFDPDGRPHEAKLVVSDRATKRETERPIPVDTTLLLAGDHHGSTFYQHKAFCDLVRKGSGKPDVSLDDGLWSLRVGEAAERSARTGESVHL